MDKNTGLFHDDDGNLDDRRIFGAVMLAAAVAAGTLAIFVTDTPNAASEIALGFMWGGIALMGVTVGEKFKRK
jgi:hypothetical protein